MPRTTRTAPRRSTARNLAASPVLRPYADADSLRAFRAAPTATRAKVAKQVAQAKANGASGEEMRETFGDLLSGPNRRALLREYGFDTATYIARSYDAYRDGDSRKGTQHAREHGAQAEERRAAREAEERAAKAAARKAAKAARDAAKATGAAKAKPAPRRTRKAA
jgi:hypothetical protein